MGKRVAKFACEILSPAASKIVCAGSTDDDQALYQTFAGLTDKERFADLDAHAQALGEYLVNRPDLYEVTATKSKGSFDRHGVLRVLRGARHRVGHKDPPSPRTKKIY